MKLHDLAILRENRQDLPGLNDLLQSGISFVVVGAIARNMYCNRPRNTQDIDVLTNDYNELADYIHSKFPYLEMTKGDVVIRFGVDGEELIDIMIPYNKLFEIVLNDTKRVGEFEIASPESLVAMKFAAIMGEHRSLESKYQDRGDIASILIKTPIDLKKVKQHLAVLYKNAPSDFQAFIDQLKQDFELP